MLIVSQEKKKKSVPFVLLLCDKVLGRTKVLESIWDFLVSYNEYNYYCFGDLYQLLSILAV
jgi:hypothetical protein